MKKTRQLLILVKKTQLLRQTSEENTAAVHIRKKTQLLYLTNKENAAVVHISNENTASTSD